MSTVLSYEARRMGDIAEKVEHGERLTLEDGLFLYESEDLLTIGLLADKVNLRKNGKKSILHRNDESVFHQCVRSALRVLQLSQRSGRRRRLYAERRRNDRICGKT